MGQGNKAEVGRDSRKLMRHRRRADSWPVAGPLPTTPAALLEPCEPSILFPSRRTTVVAIRVRVLFAFSSPYTLPVGLKSPFKA
jgi:hypothetical protein